MKKLFFLSVMLWAGALFGQQPFAPVGAKWYVGTGNIYSVYEVTKDTLIHGYSMRKIVHPERPDILTFQDSAKVYYWSQSDTSLRLIYDFEVTLGDSVAFQFDFQLDPKVYWRGTVTKDSTVNVGADSLRWISCDLAPSNDTLSSACCIPYIYLERVGALFYDDLDFGEGPPYPRIGFLPALDISIATGPPEILRCYEDESVTYQSPRFRITGNNQPCDYGTALNITAAGKRNLNLFPNPTTGLLTLTLPTNVRPAEASGKLLDLNGRVVKDFTFVSEEITLELEDLPAGMYVLACYAGKDLLSRQKVVLRR